MLSRGTHLNRFLLVAAVVGAASLGFANDEPAGKGLFLKNKCNTCHEVSTEGIKALRGEGKAPDMSKAASEIPSAEWAEKFVMREETKDGKKHLRPWKGSEKDLKAIVDWIMTLKTS